MLQQQLINFGIEPIGLPLPQEISCTAVVFPPADDIERHSAALKQEAERWILTNVRPPLSRVVSAALARPDIRVLTVPIAQVADKTIERIRGFGATEEQFAAIRRAPRAYYVHGNDTIEHPRAGAWAVLCAALSIGWPPGSIVVDGHTSIWNTNTPFEDLYFCGIMRARSFLLTPVRKDDAGTNTVSTVGMARFGLPELRIEGIENGLVEDIVEPLLGLAQQLAGDVMTQVEAKRSITALQIPSELHLSPSNVMLASGDSPREDTFTLPSFTVRLRLDTEYKDGVEKQVLSVVPPNSCRGSIAKWQSDLAEGPL